MIEELALADNTEVVELKSNIEHALAESAEIAVFTISDLNAAAHYIKNYKELARRIETIRKDAKAPLIQRGKEIDSYCKDLVAQFKPELDRLNTEVGAFNRKMKEQARQKAEAERKAAEEKALAEAIEKEEKLKAEAKERGENPEEVKVEVAVVPEVVHEEKKISQLNTSGLQMRRTRKWKYADDFDIVKFVRSLNDEQIRLFVELNERTLAAERAKYDMEFEGDAPGLPGILFYYTETPV